MYPPPAPSRRRCDATYCDVLHGKAHRGHDGGMFLFFSNRLGCLGSLLVSAVITVVLVLLLSR